MAAKALLRIRQEASANAFDAKPMTTNRPRENEERSTGTRSHSAYGDEPNLSGSGLFDSTPDRLATYAMEDALLRYWAIENHTERETCSRGKVLDFI